MASSGSASTARSVSRCAIPWFRKCGRLGGVDLVVQHRERPPCETRKTDPMCPHFYYLGSAWDQAGRRIAPAFTIGFMVLRALSSTAMTESNGGPVVFTPSFARATS